MNIKVQTYNIRADYTTKAWLDSYDGEGEWSWTHDQKQAWRLSGKEAQRRLRQVRKHHPDAIMEPTKKRVT